MLAERLFNNRVLKLRSEHKGFSQISQEAIANTVEHYFVVLDYRKQLACQLNQLLDIHQPILSRPQYESFYWRIDPLKRAYIKHVIEFVTGYIKRHSKEVILTQPAMQAYTSLHQNDGNWFGSVNIYPRYVNNVVTDIVDIHCCLYKPYNNEPTQFIFHRQLNQQDQFQREYRRAVSTMLQQINRFSPKEYLLLEKIAQEPSMTNMDLAEFFQNTRTTINKHASNILSKSKTAFARDFRDLREVAEYLRGNGLING